MEEKRETASAVNDEPAVEIIDWDEPFAENGEPIPAEILAMPDEPVHRESLKTHTPRAVSEETESQPLLEISADPSEQFQDNCRKVAAGPLSSGLQAAIATGSFALVHALVTHNKVSHLPITIGLFVFAIVFRMLYIRWRAKRQAKTKFSLQGNWLTASGPEKSSNWKIHISNLDKATLISESKKKDNSLVLTTSTHTRVLRGLEDPEKLLLSLPQEIQVDTSALKQKLQQFADSLFECKDAEEIALLRDAEHVQMRARESIRDVPDVRFLKQDLSGIVLITIVTVLFACGCMAVAHFGYAQYSIPLLTFVTIFYLPILRSLLKTDCLYIFSADALFELDRKNGFVQTITLDRVSIRGSVNEGESLYIDNQTGLPVHIEKEDSAYIRRCLKKYPHTD